MKPFQVGLLGAGVVGGGTFAVLQRNQEEIRRRAGREIRITQIADVDLALRYGPMASMPPNAIRLFGEQLTPAPAIGRFVDRDLVPPGLQLSDDAAQKIVKAVKGG